jgi:hypothetical protein
MEIAGKNVPTLVMAATLAIIILLLLLFFANPSCADCMSDRVSQATADRQIAFQNEIFASGDEVEIDMSMYNPTTSTLHDVHPYAWCMGITLTDHDYATKDLRSGEAQEFSYSFETNAPPGTYLCVMNALQDQDVVTQLNGSDFTLTVR